MKNLEPLPLDHAWPEIVQALGTHRNLVLVAEPGAGKTTRFPPRLLDSKILPPEQKVLMLEPRRLAARASAHRIAVEQGWVLGGAEIGYQVRFDNRTTPRTRLQVLTEGLLSQRLKTESDLGGVGAVILDEFHERSQHTDLALGLLYELQELARPDLRIIVMSATLDADRVSKFLKDCPVVRVPGRTYPVELQHSKRPLSLDTGPAFLDAVADATCSVVTGASPRSGDVLVFLPGAREIRGVRERVAPTAERAGFVCLELHGGLPLEEQDRVIRKDPARGKVILSTNIAETSLTIDGVGTVIDSGLARVVRCDAAGFERLQISRISLASATQRAGRAGRQGPGYCYRLWSKLDEGSMPEFELPEVLRTDLSEALLTLLAQGVSDADGFSWFEKPPSSAIAIARQALTDLGFRDSQTGGLTTEGREALKLPLPARLARLVLEALKAEEVRMGARLAALLSEKDIVLRAADLKYHAAFQSDVLLRLHLLDERRSMAVATDVVAIRNVARVASFLESAATRLRVTKSSRAGGEVLSEDEQALRLLLLAYPDRVCRRRRPKEAAARMVGGRGVRLAPFSSVETAEFFLSIDSSEPPSSVSTGGARDVQVSVASRIERDWLKEAFPENLRRINEVVFDAESLTVQKRWFEAFHDLPLEEPHVSRPSAEEAFAPLVAACRERWDVSFAAEESLARALARLNFVRARFSESAVFEFAAAQSAFLEEVCYGETRLSDVLAKPLGEAFLRHLPAELAALLTDAAPESITVPSGSRIRIHYPEGQSPFLEVRIQEIFGMRESPRVARGAVPVVLHLLGPNYRPVQVTSDLQSFWRGGYNEVRKELRARYPKHSWPEDPLTATPEAKGRRRGSSNS